MKFIPIFIIGLCIIIILVNPRLRIFINYLPQVLKWTPSDIYKYFKYKKYNDAPIGCITGYIADSGVPFGSGKTLSSVDKLSKLVKRYDNKVVYHKERFVRQHIVIFSNIHINIPGAIKISCIKEYSDNMELLRRSKDRYVCYLHVDEAGSEFNSRAFAGNFTADFISDIVTCRHNWSSFFYTAQEFGMVDKLLRSVTIEVWACSHWGRVFFQRCFLPKSLENVDDISMLKPSAVKGFFATDKLYSLYDTYARFERMKKDVDAGNVLTPEEIIERRSHDNSAYSSAKFNGKGKRFFKKIKK